MGSSLSTAGPKSDAGKKAKTAAKLKISKASGDAHKSKPPKSKKASSVGKKSNSTLISTRRFPSSEVPTHCTCLQLTDFAFDCLTMQRRRKALLLRALPPNLADERRARRVAQSSSEATSPLPLSWLSLQTKVAQRESNDPLPLVRFVFLSQRTQQRFKARLLVELEIFQTRRCREAETSPSRRPTQETRPCS